MGKITATKEELESLYFNQGLSPREIAKILGHSDFGIRKRMRQLGISLRDMKSGTQQRRWKGKTKPTKERLEELYVNQRLSVHEIGVIFDVSGPCIWDYLNAFGIPRNTTSELNAERYHNTRRNDDFFKVWTPEMAWVLGLMFTDGNVNKTMNAAQLTSIDTEMLEQVARLMGSKSKPKFHQGRTYTIQIGATTTCEDLVTLGCVPNKSRVMQFPIVPEDLLSHFVRGLWDGDGSLFTRRREKHGFEGWASYVSGSEAFVVSLRDTIHGILGVIADVKQRQSIYNPYWIITYYNRRDVTTLITWMYQDSSKETRLRRKYQKAQAILG